MCKPFYYSMTDKTIGWILLIWFEAVYIETENGIEFNLRI